MFLTLDNNVIIKSILYGEHVSKQTSNSLFKRIGALKAPSKDLHLIRGTVIKLPEGSG